MSPQTTTLPDRASLSQDPENKDLSDSFRTEDCDRNLQALNWQLAVKRAFDILVALVGIILFSPLFLLIGLAVFLESGRPVFFSQERMGLRGNRFFMLKFRSMRTQVDPEVERLQREAADAGTLLKLQNDPRVTRLGRFLRSTSLDELPQLINILKGEMSLVGPRPLIPFMLTPYPEFARARSLLRPGITGIWQVRDREANTSAAGMMRYDLEYVREFSLWLDLRLLLETPLAVLRRTGAF